MNYKPEVLTPSVPPVWVGNALVFATREEAELWGRDLMSRWIVPMDSRAVETDEPVNYKRLPDGTVESVKP